MSTAIQWPSFQGTATLVGTTGDGRCSVYYDASLGVDARNNAADLLGDAPRIMGLNDSYFGKAGGQVNVILFAMPGAGGVPATDGTGGADHMACDFITGQNIEVCVAYGLSARCSALFEAELSECSMNGNLCGKSAGEALSRRCADDVAPGALAIPGFLSVPVWAQDGMPNFVDQTDPTDRNYDAIGCGLAFLSWLNAMGYGLTMVAPHMVVLGDTSTLAELYFTLTGDAQANAWLKFLMAVATGASHPFTTDDPFAGISLPAPGPTPPQPTPPPPAPTPSPLPNSTKIELLHITTAINRLNTRLLAIRAPHDVETMLMQAATRMNDAAKDIFVALNATKPATVCTVGHRRLVVK